MGMIYKAVTTEYPGGLAHLVVQALFKKYEPDDKITRVEMRELLAKVSMKAHQDPTSLFEQISAIQNRYNNASRKIDEEDLIAVILKAAPKDYQAVLTVEQRVKGDKLVLADLESAMHQHWRQTKANKDEDKSGNEISLSAFSGTCFHCKKKGHKANKCPEKEKSSGKKFKGKCNNCGKEGHKAADCWEKEENKDKRPKGYKVSTEKANAAVDNNSGGGTVEFLLCGVTFPLQQDLLDDPNVWIADSAATVHSTPHSISLTNVKEAKGSDAITMGNGGTEQANKIADIKGIMCNKYGVEMGQATLTEVTILPTGKFNLFSLTKLMNHGWILGGDDETMWLTKGERTVTFDIKIPTPKGTLYAMYFKRESKPEIAAVGIQGTIKVNYQEMHDKLGHCNEDMTRKAAKLLGFEIASGNVTPCEACTIAKAKQQNVPKESQHIPAKESNGRVYLDIASLRSTDDNKISSNSNWRIIVDEKTQLKFSDFFNTKIGMVEPTCQLFYKWKDQGIPVKIVRCDDA